MTRYAFRRVAVAVPTILAIAIFTFILVRMAPGDPAQALVPVDESYNPQALQIVRHEWGLDKPLPTQFWLWVHNAFEGNLGTSISTRVPVATLTFQRLPVTLELASTALIVAALVGVLLGVTSAVRGRTFDSASRVGLLLGLSVPNFVFGILLIMLFGLYLPGFIPYAGWVSPRQSIGGNLSHLILPAFALALAPSALIARQCRSSMLDVLDRDYIQMARAFGVQQWKIVWLDALKNSLIPVLSILGVVMARLIAGSVVIENIFDIPGTGRLLFNALQLRDYPLVSGVVLVLSLFVVLITLGVDVLYGFVNPRIARSYGKA